MKSLRHSKPSTQSCPLGIRDLVQTLSWGTLSSEDPLWISLSNHMLFSENMLEHSGFACLAHTSCFLYTH